jgi:NitT/TauT family transport system ATP-binding protein
LRSFVAHVFVLAYEIPNHCKFIDGYNGNNGNADAPTMITPESAPSAAPSIVALRGVGKTFGNGVVALDGFDLSVRPGEFLTLLGPSGCGKSTALRIVAGLSEPDRGKVEWSDSTAGAAKTRRQIGFVFQEPTLMPWASVEANVCLPLRLLGLEAGAPARIGAALDRVGLAGFAQAYPRELSGGMKMRASIARALVTEPTLLLMDEPFAALDEITRFRLNSDLLALWQTLGKTVVFVTHSVFESVFLSTRIIVMSPRPGRVFRELVIGAPYPRDERFRTSAEYAGWCRMASEALADAMATRVTE